MSLNAESTRFFGRRDSFCIDNRFKNRIDSDEKPITVYH